MSARPKRDQPLLPSVLDRLLDDEPRLSQEPSKNLGQVVRELKAAVLRDLQDLLNTRWRCVSWPPNLDELDVSLVNYGIPDFTAPNFRAADDPLTLLRIIEQTIRNFEPRLRNVRVTPLASSQSSDRVLRFRIDAVLYVEPVEETVWFKSEVEPSTGSFQVEAGR